jgi:RNA polymerase sigma-70 factor (ECF subfamily)
LFHPAESDADVGEDHSQYARLIAPIEERMIHSVWRVVRQPEDFDDAFQEALIVVWRRLHKVRRHPNPHALILRICINAAYDVLRKKAKLRRREALSAIPETIPDPDVSAAERLIRQDRRDEIYGAIGRLPRKQAEVVLMRFVQGLSYPEIAQALGCSESAARQLILRARGRLAPMLAHLVPMRPQRPQEATE